LHPPGAGPALAPVWWWTAARALGWPLPHGVQFTPKLAEDALDAIARGGGGLRQKLETSSQADVKT